MRIFLANVLFLGTLAWALMVGVPADKPLLVEPVTESSPTTEPIATEPIAIETSAAEPLKVEPERSQDIEIPAAISHMPQKDEVGETGEKLDRRQTVDLFRLADEMADFALAHSK